MKRSNTVLVSFCKKQGTITFRRKGSRRNLRGNVIPVPYSDCEKVHKIKLKRDPDDASWSFKQIIISSRLPDRAIAVIPKGRTGVICNVGGWLKLKITKFSGYSLVLESTNRNKNYGVRVPFELSIERKGITYISKDPQVDNEPKIGDD